MEKQEASAESPSNERTEHEGTSSTTSRSTSSSSEKRQLPQDDNKEGFSNVPSTKRTRTGNLMSVELTRPLTSSLSRRESQSTYTFGDQASRMVNAPVTGDISFGDNYNNSPNTHSTCDNRYNQGHMIAGGTFNNPTFNQQIFHCAPIPSQAPSTSSSASSQPRAEDWQKKLVTVQTSLKEMYCQRFKETNPFSLPFTFHIENMWVSVALSEDLHHTQATEDHAELLRKALINQKMLIIEGNPASGKTSLMRRLAYEWSKGKQQLSCYDLVLYSEFREVREKTFESIVDLVLYYSKTFLKKASYEKLEKLMNDERFCEECRILVLLDGYDESSKEKQCSELKSYLFETVVGRALLFNVIITTRKGYLSNLHGRRGRFVFAEVLGFTTKQQKEKYIFNHFLSSEIDNKRNIAAVHSLLKNNENLDTLAETPLFLTFICLVHERIVDGTLLELYCNIIWWLIDRHQQDFPDRDIPHSFGFQYDSAEKFETIQDHFLHFPQLHCLGKMAMCNIDKDIFQHSDYEKFNLQPIIEQVGLLRKEKEHDNSFKLVTSFFFPHRTIQEFLAAFYCFCSNDPTSEWLLPDSKLNTTEDGGMSEMNEFEKFLFRIALSDKMPIQAEKRKYYFEKITDIKMDMTFDAFNTTASFKNEQLSWFFSQCTNVQSIELNGKLNTARHAGKSTTTPSPTLFSFSNLIKLHSLTFGGEYSKCVFGADSQLSITNCPSLKNLKFEYCTMKSSTIVDIATLPAMETLRFTGIFKATSRLSFNDLIKLHSLTFGGCTFSANSQLSFTNCPSLKTLEFEYCTMKSSTIVGIETLPAIDTVVFDDCDIDLATWQSITDQISQSIVKYLEVTFEKDFNKEFLIHLQQCSNVEKMEIAIYKYTIRQNDLFSICDLTKLHSLTFGGCTFSANSQLSFKNCPSLKNIGYRKCIMEKNIDLGTIALPAIDSVQFWECNTDLAIWQSVTDQISHSNVKCLKVSFGDDFNKEFLIHLQRCNVQKLKITVTKYNFVNDLSLSYLTKLHSLTFGDKYCLYGCTFSANSQLSFTNCSSLKSLKFRKCEIGSSKISGIATLPALDTVEFKECKMDSATWQSITDQISSSNVICLKLDADFFEQEKYPECQHLHKCERIQKIHVNSNYNLRYKGESVTANLALTARKLPALTSIIISNHDGRRLDEFYRLSERNRELIETAGQRRNPQFSIKYVGDPDPELEEYDTDFDFDEAED